MGLLDALKGLFGGAGAAEVSPEEAMRLLREEGAVLVDVRETVEWKGGHAAGAKHIPLGDLDRKAAQLPKDKPVLVMCARGMRSRTGAKRLAAAGFPRVLSVRGGLSAWQRSGLPVKK